MKKLAAINIRETFFGSHPGAAGIDKPTKFLSTLLPNIYILAAVILFLYLIFGGLTIIMASSSTENTEKGKQIITNAIIGFVIIFASYWIIQLIEIITGINILGNA